MTDFPALVFAASLVTLWLSARAGAYAHTRTGKFEPGVQADYSILHLAALTLLGLIIGFSFSMAISRYDARKNSEATEANAISTEYLRAGLLPASGTTGVRGLLTSYLNYRILFYTTRNPGRLRQIEALTSELDIGLWSAVQDYAARRDTAVPALIVSGMNDVLNSQAYTQAAWRNRIPNPAWFLIAAIAVCCNYMVGYTTRSPGASRLRFFVLPLLLSISFFFISDIDSPRGGIILVHPHNLESLRGFLRQVDQNSQPNPLPMQGDRDRSRQ